MEKNEEKQHFVKSVIENRKKTMPPIIREGIAFREILKNKASRQALYSKMKEEWGVSVYDNSTYKKYFLYPLSPIQGIPQKDYERIIQTMVFCIEDTIMWRLEHLRSAKKKLDNEIKKVEKFLRQNGNTAKSKKDEKTGG